MISRYDLFQSDLNLKHQLRFFSLHECNININIYIYIYIYIYAKYYIINNVLFSKCLPINSLIAFQIIFIFSL